MWFEFLRMSFTRPKLPSLESQTPSDLQNDPNCDIIWHTSVEQTFIPCVLASTFDQKLKWRLWKPDVPFLSKWVNSALDIKLMLAMSPGLGASVCYLLIYHDWWNFRLFAHCISSAQWIRRCKKRKGVDIVFISWKKLWGKLMVHASNEKNAHFSLFYVFIGWGLPSFTK